MKMFETKNRPDKKCNLRLRFGRGRCVGLGFVAVHGPGVAANGLD